MAIALARMFVIEHGRNIKAFVNYQTAANEAILVKVGISGTGIEGARKNLAAEIPGWDFDGDPRRRGQAVETDIQRGQGQNASIRTSGTTFYANLYLSCPGAGLIQ